MPKPTVWILKEQTVTRQNGPVVFDYTGVLEYGDIEFVTNLDYPPSPSETVKEEWVRQMKAFMAKYNPETDWIVPTGSPLSLFVAGAIVSSLDKPVKLLVWQQRAQRYYPVTIGA